MRKGKRKHRKISRKENGGTLVEMSGGTLDRIMDRTFQDIENSRVFGPRKRKRRNPKRKFYSVTDPKNESGVI